MAGFVTVRDLLRLSDTPDELTVMQVSRGLDCCPHIAEIVLRLAKERPVMEDEKPKSWKAEIIAEALGVNMAEANAYIAMERENPDA